MVGVKVRFRTQPLPVLKDAQPNEAGPDQPGGRTAPLAFEMPNPVIVRPSLEVNVTLMVLVVPTSTDTKLLGAVATTLSWVPLTPLASLVKPVAFELMPATVLVATDVLPYSEL